MPGAKKTLFCGLLVVSNGPLTDGLKSPGAAS